MVEQPLHSELAWVGPASTQVHELLGSMQGVLDGVYAHISSGELHLYVLDILEYADNEFADALAKLEVRLSKALNERFVDVVVHTISLHSLRDEEASFFRTGVKLL